MRKLLPFEETRALVRQMGFDTKEEYKFGIKGPYFVRDPDLVYEEDWRGWDDYLGCMLPFEEARVVSRSVCKRLGAPARAKGPLALRPEPSPPAAGAAMMARRFGAPLPCSRLSRTLAS